MLLTMPASDGPVELAGKLPAARCCAVLGYCTRERTTSNVPAVYVAPAARKSWSDDAGAVVASRGQAWDIDSITIGVLIIFKKSS